MNQSFQTQTDQPLFPKVLWSRPVNRAAAGRLMLIGGHKSDFALIQNIYSLALASGIGHCLVVLPDSLRLLLQNFPDTYFVPSSPSGSIGKAAIGELISLAQDYDALSVGANLSNNSETAVVCEPLVTEVAKPITLYQDALNALGVNPKTATNQPNALLVLTMPELFKLAGKLQIPLAIHPERGLLGRVEIVAQVGAAIRASLVCIGQEIIILSNGETIVTPAINPKAQAAIYAVFSALWTERQTLPYLATAAYIVQAASKQLPASRPMASSHIRQAFEAALHSAN